LGGKHGARLLRQAAGISNEKRRTDVRRFRLYRGKQEAPLTLSATLPKSSSGAACKGKQAETPHHC